MDDKKLLNGKFTFKSCVVQKKRASLLSENVNRQLAESKEVVGLPFIGNLTVTVTNNRQAYYFFAFSRLPVDIFKSKLSIQKLFIIHFAVSRSPFTQTVTLAYYTVCEAKKNVRLIKNLTLISQ